MKMTQITVIHLQDTTERRKALPLSYLSLYEVLHFIVHYGPLINCPRVVTVVHLSFDACIYQD